MTPSVRTIALLTVLAGALGACGDDDGVVVDPGPYTLTFAGDATFQGAHGDQTVHAALVQASDGAVLERAEATVSGTADPAFSFTFANLLEAGDSYAVHYWIDSNFAGGSPGACDPPANDHQWNVSIGTLDEDRTHTESHRPSETTSVCSTFAATLTFQGDATFQGAHGGQAVAVAILDADGDVVGRADGTVSGTADPTFSFTFAGLPLGGEYTAHYWIDSNFAGGTAGACDPRANDHQWSVSLGVLEGDVTHTEDHRPTETADVCPTFASTLTFRGDATFQGAHGGQAVAVAILDADGAVVGRADGTVSGTADPTFSFEFPGLPRGVTYTAHYWIDSNFGGGTVGTCDPAANDHQWSVDIGTLEGDLVHTEDHRPGDTGDVCSSFP